MNRISRIEIFSSTVSTYVLSIVHVKSHGVDKCNMIKINEKEYLAEKKIRSRSRSTCSYLHVQCDTSCPYRDPPTVEIGSTAFLGFFFALGQHHLTMGTLDPDPAPQTSKPKRLRFSE